MNKNIGLFVLFLIVNTVKAQEIKDNGSIVLVDGSILNGFIELDDSFKTPNIVSVSVNGKIKSYSPAEVLSVEFDNNIYVAKWLKIDQTDTNLNSISGIINEESVTKHVFLKKVVEGDVSLLTYKDSRVHYFISKNEDFIELIRIPRFHSNGKSNPYNKYLGQLTILLSDCLKQERISKTEYSFTSLKKLINDYNVCVQGESSYIVSKNPIRVNLSLVAGFKFTEYDINKVIEGKRNFYKSEKDKEPTFGLAIDFNILKNYERLKLYNELLYQSYGYEVSLRDEQNANFYVNYTTTFDTKYLELTNSLRYYLFKNTNNINPYFGLNLTNGFALSNDSQETTYLFFYDTERFMESSFNGVIKKYAVSYSLSLGLQYKGLVLEGRYGYNPNLSRYPTITNAKNFSLLLQYKIL